MRLQFNDAGNMNASAMAKIWNTRIILNNIIVPDSIPNFYSLFIAASGSLLRIPDLIFNIFLSLIEKPINLFNLLCPVPDFRDLQVRKGRHRMYLETTEKHFLEKSYINITNLVQTILSGSLRTIAKTVMILSQYESIKWPLTFFCE